MIWQNPVAWFGLAMVAIPIAIHLLGRRTARVQRFPTLRFLGVAPLVAPRRRRLSDIALLIARVGIVLAAVAALARPLFDTNARRRDSERLVARAIIVDTSASTARATPSGASARDVVRADAQRAAAAAATSVVIETASPAGALDGAAEWLRSQPGRRDLVVISDFQLGALDSVDIAQVRGDVAVTLLQVAVAPGAQMAAPRVRLANGTVTARVSLVSDRTSVEWIGAGAVTPAPEDSIQLFAGARERARADAARRASRTLRAPAGVVPRPIAIVFPGFERRAEIVRSAQPLNAPWMGDVVARIRDDATLAFAAAREATIDSSAYGTPFIALARTETGRAVAVAARANIDGRDRLVLLPLSDAGSLASASLMNAALRALDAAPPASEFEPGVVAGATLATWQRAVPIDVGAIEAAAGQSDGRWFWMLALAFIAVETIVRRRARTAEAHAGPNA